MNSREIELQEDAGNFNEYNVNLIKDYQEFASDKPVKNERRVGQIAPFTN